MADTKVTLKVTGPATVLVVHDERPPREPLDDELRERWREFLGRPVVADGWQSEPCGR